jgi:hypothetical protein
MRPYVYASSLVGFQDCGAPVSTGPVDWFQSERCSKYGVLLRATDIRFRSEQGRTDVYSQLRVYREAFGYITVEVAGTFSFN